MNEPIKDLMIGEVVSHLEKYFILIVEPPLDPGYLRYTYIYEPDMSPDRPVDETQRLSAWTTTSYRFDGRNNLKRLL